MKQERSQGAIAGSSPAIAIELPEHGIRLRHDVELCREESGTGDAAIKARIEHALCDARLVGEISTTAAQTGRLARTLTWGDGGLENVMRRHSASFTNVDTACDDVCLLAFTSGTTGDPKATMHFHRDVLIMADVVGRHLLETGPDDIYAGSPPLGFTFGLGALLVFPPTRALTRRWISRHYAGRTVSFITAAGRVASGRRGARPADFESTAVDDDLDQLGR